MGVPSEGQEVAAAPLGVVFYNFTPIKVTPPPPQYHQMLSPASSITDPGYAHVFVQSKIFLYKAIFLILKRLSKKPKTSPSPIIVN